MFHEAAYYARMAAGLYRYVRAPATADPEAKIRDQVQNREARFLDTVGKVVFSNPAHPYYEMFRLAGCTAGDLEKSVRRDGLESTLEKLYWNGVWLEHDEFKGAKPIIRAGKQIPSSRTSFRNPLVHGVIESSSGASRSRGTRTPRSVEDLVMREDQEVLRRREFGLSGRTLVEVRAILPSTTGLNPCVRTARSGRPVERWFVPGGNWRTSMHYRAATYALVLWANCLGARVPWPRHLPWNDFSPVAEWVARRRQTGGSCAIGASVSSGVRIARAAMDQGIDISGTLFLLHGEPLSEAKAAVILKAGCLASSHYGISEIGSIGCACQKMANRNCTHLFRDSVAAIGVPRLAPISGVEVNSLLFTTLYPTAPHVFINVDMQDCGCIEEVNCDCTFSRMGFNQQVRDVYSFGKLTGFGITLLGTDVVRLLEDLLPRRLGGGPGDCQLAESDHATGTRLALRISPRLKVESSEHVKACFLSELKSIYGGSLAARTWAHAEAIEMVLEEPFATRAGKVLPLHLIRGTAEKARAS